MPFYLSTPLYLLPLSIFLPSLFLPSSPYLSIDRCISISQHIFISLYPSLHLPLFLPLSISPLSISLPSALSWVQSGSLLISIDTSLYLDTYSSPAISLSLTPPFSGTLFRSLPLSRYLSLNTSLSPSLDPPLYISLSLSPLSVPSRLSLDLYRSIPISRHLSTSLFPLSLYLDLYIYISISLPPLSLSIFPPLYPSPSFLDLSNDTPLSVDTSLSPSVSLPLDLSPSHSLFPLSRSLPSLMISIDTSISRHLFISISLPSLDLSPDTSLSPSISHFDLSHSPSMFLFLYNYTSFSISL